MDTQTILFAVKAEISRLQKVADLLETPETLPVARRIPINKGHVWSPPQRAAMSRKLRASWKARQKKSK